MRTGGFLLFRGAGNIKKPHSFAGMRHGCYNDDMKNLWIVNGTMGAGKSAVGEELAKILPDNAYLDGDWCWNVRPFFVNERAKERILDNICLILGNYLKEPSLKNIIFTWVLHDWTVTQTILSRLPLENVNVRAFTLTLSEKTLRARLMKDVAEHKRTADVIERSVVRLPLYENMPAQKISAETLSPAEIAKKIKDSL